MLTIGTYHTGSFKSGKNHPNWKGGVTSINHKVRMSARFAEWRKKVFERDNWTCVSCHIRGGILHPDHITHLADILKEGKISSLEEAYNCSEIWSIENGRTLCQNCHGNRHGIRFNQNGNRTYKEFKCFECSKSFKLTTRQATKNRKFCGRNCYFLSQKKTPNKGWFKKGVTHAWNLPCYKKVFGSS